jgi:hypothetical protein
MSRTTRIARSNVVPNSAIASLLREINARTRTAIISRNMAVLF